MRVRISRHPYLVTFVVQPFRSIDSIVKLKNTHLTFRRECRSEIVILHQLHTKTVFHISVFIVTLEIIAQDCHRNIATNGIGLYHSLAYTVVNIFLCSCQLRIHYKGNLASLTAWNTHYHERNLELVTCNLQWSHAERIFQCILCKIYTTMRCIIFQIVLLASGKKQHCRQCQSNKQFVYNIFHISFFEY